MPFIPIDKMKQLREQAKNGDARAKQILDMQLRNQDFSSLLEEHFKPVQTEPENKATSLPQENAIVEGSATKQNGKLQEFLDYNGVKEGDPEYNDMVESFYEEYPNLRPKEEKQEPEQEPGQDNAEQVQENPGLFDELSNAVKDLLSVCDRAIIAVADDNENDITGAALKGTLSTLQEIKQSVLDAFEKIKGLKDSVAKKQENDIM